MTASIIVVSIMAVGVLLFGLLLPYISKDVPEDRADLF